MRTSDICPTCSTFSNALCTLYNGEYLPTLDIDPLDSLEVIINKIENYATTISPTSLGDLTDVDLTGLEDNQVIQYDEDTQTWLPVNLSIYEEVTIVELNTLIENNNLKEGVLYLVTDYRTIKPVTNTGSDEPLYIAPIEQIFLFALSNNTVSSKGYSKTFKGEIITYNQDYVVPSEDTYPKGLITARELPFVNLKVGTDFRGTRCRRYKASAPVWVAGSYNEYDIVNHDGYLWLCINSTSDEPTNNDGLPWSRIIESDSYLFIDSIFFGNAFIDIDTEDFEDLDMLQVDDTSTLLKGSNIIIDGGSSGTSEVGFSSYAEVDMVLYQGFDGFSNCDITVGSASFIRYITNSKIHIGTSIVNVIDNSDLSIFDSIINRFVLNCNIKEMESCLILAGNFEQFSHNTISRISNSTINTGFVENNVTVINNLECYSGNVIQLKGANINNTTINIAGFMFGYGVEKISFTSIENCDILHYFIGSSFSILDGFTTVADYNNKATYDLLLLTDIKSGATQVGAGADVNELWKTAGHATLPDNVILIGV